MKLLPLTRNLSSRQLRHHFLFAGCLFLATQSIPAQAQSGRPEPQEVSQARDYFRAGAQAYAIGEYAAAVQAFEQAYALAPRPAVLFSIAQAERRQYFASNEREHLEKAIRLYRKYLRDEPQASRKTDAVQALSELEPMLSARPPQAQVTPESLPTALNQGMAAPTRLMLTSPVEGVTISVDGGSPQGSPLIREIEPGEHLVRVTAPGYYTDERRIVAVEGALVTLDISLMEQPAKLLVKAPSGAELRIDGRVQGICPFPKPLELSPGDHLVTFTMSGHETWSREQRLSRGETTTVSARLPRTIQRTTSYILFGAAGSTVPINVFLAILTVTQENSAKAFLASQGKSRVTPDELNEYNSIRSDRDKLRIATLTTAGAGLGLALLGAFLFNYDSQSASKPSTKSETTQNRWGSAPRERASSQLSANPQLSPGFTGLSLSGSF